MGANYDETGIGYDTTFELNEFNEPRIRSEIETLKDVVLFILFSKPGSYPSLPEIGLNIEDYLYSFYDELDVNELKDKLKEQCSILAPYMTGGAIAIQKTKYNGQPSLIINIEGNETFPPGYKKDQIGNSKRYLIGLTYDDMQNLIYNVNAQ